MFSLVVPLKAGKDIAMKKFFLYSGIALFAASCASQKYSRTDNIVDDVYFSPSDAPQSVEVEAPEERQQDGFQYDQNTNTPNPNADYYSYSPYRNSYPDTTTQSVNYSGNNYQTVTNNYYSGYGNSYNGYTNYGPNRGFAFQHNFGVFYTPSFGWGARMNGFNPYGYGGMFTPYYSPFGYSPFPNYSCYPGWGYNPGWGWNSGWGYNPYGYSPVCYNPGYGYSPGYGYGYNYGPGWGYGSIGNNSPGITQGGPRNTGSSALPSTLYGPGRVKAPVSTPTTPEKHIYRPSDRQSANDPSTPSRGAQGNPGVNPQDGSNGRVAPNTPNTPQRQDPPRTREPENRPSPQQPSPRTREPERRPQPTPQQPPRTREPERRPSPTPQPQRTRVPERRPTPSVSPSPSRTPSAPRPNNNNTPQRRR